MPRSDEPADVPCPEPAAALFWRAEIPNAESPGGCSVLRVVGLWDNTVIILTRDSLPIGCESYPSAEDAIRHANHEWGPITVCYRYDPPRPTRAREAG